jgi:hypothetical protein
MNTPYSFDHTAVAIKYNAISSDEMITVHIDQTLHLHQSLCVCAQTVVTD